MSQSTNISMKVEKIGIREREAFFKDLNHEVKLCKKEGSTLSVMIITILNFRDITTTLGYENGDLLLASFSQRLQEILKENDIIAHLRDDEFALILPSLKNIGHVELAANKISSVVSDPFEIGDQVLRAKVAMGISIFPQHTDEPESLLQKADIALSRAITVNVPYLLYCEKSTDKLVPAFIIEAELEAGLRNNELYLNYQPKIDLGTHSVCGVEVLARWQSPEKGLVSPEVFIPVAERSGLILPLTLWVMNVAMRQSSDWYHDNNLSIAVNLSANTLHDPALLELVNRTLKIWGTDPSSLILEITESAMMIDPKHSLETLQKLQDQGVSIAIDDFGTGYSSMAYLKRLPVTELKIDKSFVLNMMNDQDDEIIVRSIIDLAHNFDIAVTAEGVEDQETLDKLTEMDCDYAQGFYMGRPMSAEGTITWLDESEWATKYRSDKD